MAHRPTRFNRRARNNMAIHRSKSGGLKFDTPQEAAAFEIALRAAQAQLGAPAGRKPTTRKTTSARKPAAAKPRAAAKSSSKKGGLRYSDPYAKIAKSIGGWSVMVRICPQIETFTQDRYAQGLQSVGLTPAKANKVLAALEAAGVLSHGTGRYARAAEAQAEARKILFAVGGINCPR
jgi:hypothetical protein